MFLYVKGLIQSKLKHGFNWLCMLFENWGISGLQKKVKPICLDRDINESCPKAISKNNFPYIITACPRQHTAVLLPQFPVACQAGSVYQGKNQVLL